MGALSFELRLATIQTVYPPDPGLIDAGASHQRAFSTYHGSGWLRAERPKPWYSFVNLGVPDMYPRSIEPLVAFLLCCMHRIIQRVMSAPVN